VTDSDSTRRRDYSSGSHAPFSGIYLITVIGAAVYFIGAADGFWGGVLGLLKAIVWPAFMVYRGLELMSL
jgi:hypothetical protein